MTITRDTVRRWAWITLVVAVVVVLWGSVVRATFSGAGCGDKWPLCNGQVIPSFQRLNTRIEFTHRMMTGVWTFMTIAMAIGTFWKTPKGHPARKASIASIILLITEALLGAVLVLRHLVENNTSLERVFVQGIHFTNTMLLLAAVTLNACLLRPPTAHPQTRSARRYALYALVVTILAGATGSLAALADTIFPSTSLREAIAADFSANSPTLIHMRWLHPAASLIVAAFCILLVREIRKTNKRAATLIAINLLLQIIIGTVDVLLLAPTWIQVLHLLSADIFWIALISVWSERSPHTAQ